MVVVGGFESGPELRIGGALARHRVQKVNEARRRHHRAHAPMRLAGMCFETRDHGLVAVHPLVRVHEPHVGGLAHDDRPYGRQSPRDLRDHRRRPDAPHLLVVREREMNGPLHPGREHFRHQGEAARAEAFHVARSAAVQPTAALRQHEGLRVPGLPVHGHDVGVSRKHHPAFDPGADRRVEVRLRAVLVRYEMTLDPVAFEVLLHELDEIEVRVARNRWKPHQLLDHLHR